MDLLRYNAVKVPLLFPSYLPAVDKRLENWREEMKKFTSDDGELVLLEHGPKSLAQSWHLQALKNRYKKIMGIND